METIKGYVVFILMLACIFCLFGCAAAPQEYKVPQPNAEQGNLSDEKEIIPESATGNLNHSEKKAGEFGEIPGAKVHVVDIWDQTAREQIACDSAVEKFWEDETAEYYFGCIKSHYILVMDSTGRIVDVIAALEEGLITIETLDAFGISYGTAPKR